MVEDIAEHLLRPLFRFVAFVLVEVLWRFVWHMLCHLTGWGTLRVVTFGRHPPSGLFDREDSGAAEWVGVLVLGVAGVFVLATIL